MPNPETENFRHTVNFLTPQQDLFSNFSDRLLQTTNKKLTSFRVLKNFPCIICFKQCELKQFATCDHKLACKECLEKYVIRSIQNNQTPKCLMEGCEAGLSTSEDTLWTEFEPKTQKKYIDSSKVNEFLSHEQTRRSITIRACSVVDCDGIVNVNSGKCVVCEHQHCLECFRDHEGQRCFNGRRTTLFLEEFLDLKRCPNCSFAVSKEGGCNKIECPQCKKPFCGKCLQTWSFKHHQCGQQYSLFQVPYFWFLQTCMGEKQLQVEDRLCEQEITFERGRRI